MPVPLQPDSRYASATLKRLPDGTGILDPHSRVRVDPADFPEHVLQVTVHPGDTVFSISSRLYGSSRLYWVVCECIQQHDPFLPLVPGSELTLITAEVLHGQVLH